VSLQIADFGMARDVADDTYYIIKGGKIPVKWTPPEVSTYFSLSSFWRYFQRPYDNIRCISIREQGHSIHCNTCMIKEYFTVVSKQVQVLDLYWLLISAHH